MQEFRSLGLGVVIVTYNSAQVIRECLMSLFASDYDDLQIVVVDNASDDDTVVVVRDCAQMQGGPTEASGSGVSESESTKTRLTLIQSNVNTGYAGGVNIGLRHLLHSSRTDLFWVLNPDCRVLTDTASKFAARAAEVGTFGLMGGRVVLVHPENTIQSDGGIVNTWTGICKNLNLAKDASVTPFPDTDAISYISGANVVSSREFLESVGLMQDNYFLYYEEVDWAFRGKGYNLAFEKDAIVLHHAGTSIGSPVIGKEFGTSFSNYFNYRSRMLFMARFFPSRLPIAYGYSFLKVLRLLLQGHLDEAEGAFRGLNNMAPPKIVRNRLANATFLGRKK